MGDDIYPPEWWGDPGSQFAIWDNNWPNPDVNSSSPIGLDWFTWNNDYTDLSPPIATSIPGTIGTFFGRDQVAVVQNHDELTFYLDNYDEPNPEKLVRVQITYYDPVGYNTFAGFDVWTEDPLTSIDHFIPANQTEGPFIHLDGNQDDTGWRTTAYDFILQPNPTEEWIGLKWEDYTTVLSFTDAGEIAASENGIFVDQVVIDTICRPVPLPAAFWLFGAGLLGFGALRRRFRR